MSCISFGAPEPRSSRILVARAIGGQFCSIMSPASVLIAVSAYDRATVPDARTPLPKLFTMLVPVIVQVKNRCGNDTDTIAVVRCNYTALHCDEHSAAAE